MNKTLKNAILLGMGAVYYSKDKVEELVHDLQEENITPEESKKFVKDVLEKVQEYKKAHEKDLKQTVLSVIRELNLVTREDLEKLARKEKAEAN